MLSRKAIAIILLLCLFYSCHIERDVTVISLQDNYDIVTPVNTKDLSPGFVFCTRIDSTGHIITEGIRRPANQWIVYDLTQNMLLDSFNLNVKQNLEINRVLPISHDTVLIAVNTVYDHDFQDGALLMIDRHGNISDTVKLDALPVRTKSHPMYNDAGRYYVFYCDFPLIFKRGKVFTPLIKWNEDGIMPASFLGCVSKDGSRDWDFTKLPIACPKTDKNHYWSMFYSSPRAVATSEYVYALFPNNSVIYRYSLSNNNTYHKKVKSSLISSISPYKINEEAKQYDPYKARYERVFCDTVNKRIYVTARIACDTMDSPLALQYNNFIYCFMMLDENLNLIGEGLIPEGYAPSIIPYRDGFLLFKKNCSHRTYTYFTPQIQTRKVSYLKNQIDNRKYKWNQIAPKMSEKEALTSYLKNIVGKDFSKYSEFLILSESSCFNCVPLYADFLKEHRQTFLDRSMAVVLINQDMDFIQKFGLWSDGELRNPGQVKVSPQIPMYAVTNQSFHRYFAYWVNARHIRYDNAGNIVSDTIINPSNLKYLIEY